MWKLYPYQLRCCCCLLIFLLAHWMENKQRKATCNVSHIEWEGEVERGWLFWLPIYFANSIQCLTLIHRGTIHQNPAKRSSIKLFTLTHAYLFSINIRSQNTRHSTTLLNSFWLDCVSHWKENAFTYIIYLKMSMDLLATANKSKHSLTNKRLSTPYHRITHVNIEYWAKQTKHTTHSYNFGAAKPS